ncbi:MAG: peptidylprolyl isomerase [Patescibacteria group bacterium]
MTKMHKVLTSLGVIVAFFIITGLIIWSGMRPAGVTKQSSKTNISQNTNKQTNTNVSTVNNANTNQPANLSSTNKNASMTYAFPGVLSDNRIANKKAIITTTKGVIELTLDAKNAPKSVSNFVYLAELGFYDGLTFHRVEPGFVIQGGDPSGNGTGGPGYKFPDEPVQGEYIEGALAMANSGPNTNGSQFFITLADVSKNLGKQYNLFGQVTKGMDVVKNITIGDVMQSVKIVSR